MTIKFFDFVCEHGHLFEASFAGLDEMQRELDEGLVRCPQCDSPRVRRLPSAPYLNAQMPGNQTEEEGEAAAERLSELRESLMAHIRDAAAKAEDVGEAFADESRRMHEGRVKRRTIKGLCSNKEAEELHREGIAVLPVPESSGKTLN